MAKESKTQEQPPVTVETVKAEPGKTTETVEIKPADAVTSEGATDSGKRTSGETPADSGLIARIEALEAEVKALRQAQGAARQEQPINEPMEEAHYIDLDGNFQTLQTRQGYAPGPVPKGWRNATDDEIAAQRKGNG